jgi:predicted transcriptional regulator YdeE
MRVMVIVKASKASEAGEMPRAELLEAMGKYNEELARSGVILAGEGLHPSSRGARVRFSGKDRTVTDGPFAETKELIAGFWLWRVGSLQEAIDWVKKCPNPMNEDSEIEIRPVFEAADFGAEFTPELREQEGAWRAEGLGLGRPTFRDTAALRLAGLNQRYTLETRAGIPRQWEGFVERDSGLPGRVGTARYGVAWNAGGDCSFDYLTGVEVSSADRLPPDFVTLDIPASRHAVLGHHGPVSEIPRTFETIWTRWVPDCGLKVARDAPCVERYSSDWNPATGAGMEIWIPLGSE